MSRIFTGISIALFFLMVSCASVPELNTHYQMPFPSDQLKGKRVVLVIEDDRKTSDLLGSGAGAEFRRFTNKVTFSIARPGEAGFRLGSYDVPGMLKEAFKRRLESEGVLVGFNNESPDKLLIISINELLLDREGRMWKGRMAYEAKIVDDGRVSSRENISGRSEKARLVGRQGADEVMGEMVSDMVNRLDLVRLFKEAGI